MSTFSCPVVRVASVENHENADRLSIVKLEGLGYTCISGKLEDGSHRYKVGDLCVYIPSAAVLPEWLLKSMDFWNAETGKGMLAGADGNRVKPLRLRGIFSEGVLFPTIPMNLIPDSCMLAVSIEHDGNDGSPMLRLGEDASEVLGITKWEPTVPVAMAGEVANLFGHTVLYDFQRRESVPDMFEPGEPVVASEKLHGCLHSDSLVMLPNGEEVTISKIVSGDYSHVLSYDTERKEYVTRKITGRMRRANLEAKKWVELTMENGRTLTLTSDHPVYSRDRQAWIDAGEIKADEDIESPIM